MTQEAHISKALKMVIDLSIDRCSQAMSKLMKNGTKISVQSTDYMDITAVTERVFSNNMETVGVFITLEGAAPFQFLFCAELEHAYLFADLMLRKEPGTCKEFDEYVTSAVGEVGNILSSVISNTLTGNFGIPYRPTPPRVVKDYLGTLFQQLLIEAATDTNQILLVETDFLVVRQRLASSMYLLPCQGSEAKLAADPSGANNDPGVL